MSRRRAAAPRASVWVALPFPTRSRALPPSCRRATTPPTPPRESRRRASSSSALPSCSSHSARTASPEHSRGGAGGTSRRALVGKGVCREGSYFGTWTSTRRVASLCARRKTDVKPNAQGCQGEGGGGNGHGLYNIFILENGCRRTSQPLGVEAIDSEKGFALQIRETR